MKPIYLIGFMGTGKSITGKKIALQLGYDFIDLDNAIELKYNTKISDIFNEFGEPTFREYESIVLREISKANTIISCGGGTPCFFDNMEYINNTGISIYLKTNRGILISRLIHNKAKRPLLSNKTDNELIKYINNLIDMREPYYMKAKHIFLMDKFKINNLLDIIKQLLLSYN